MVVYLSKNKYILDQIEYSKPTSPEVIAFCEDYLKNKLNKLKMDTHNNWLYFGYLFRLIEIKINKGEYKECENLIDEMIIGLNTFYKLYICDLNKDMLNLDEDEIFPEQFLQRFPAFLGRFLYLYGIYLMNYKQDFVFAYKIFKIAYEILKHEQRIPFFFFGNREIFMLTKDYIQLARHYALKHAFDNNAIKYVNKIIKFVKRFLQKLNIQSIRKATIYLKNYGIKLFLQKIWDKLQHDFS